MTKCESCVGFIRFFVHILEDGRTDLIDRVICLDLMTRVQGGKIDGSEGRRLMEKRYGKEKVSEAIKRAQEEGYL